MGDPERPSLHLRLNTMLFTQITKQKYLLMKTSSSTERQPTSFPLLMNVLKLQKLLSPECVHKTAEVVLPFPESLSSPAKNPHRTNIASSHHQHTHSINNLKTFT